MSDLPDANDPEVTDKTLFINTRRIDELIINFGFLQIHITRMMVEISTIIGILFLIVLGAYYLYIRFR